ncbi:Sterol 3-beta-glucosyltransferase [Purpureocillium lavendulum]|uniref:Sterol 3-beta-glucosyltransferase n=1 Tax=Purpureocillium lavendulum TaxID=1247861 RepID=A0AB34FW94_9HYPO|nr:Sterol 3-beta-glucosyltransferase [Purpureocillium lavendulum]
MAGFLIPEWYKVVPPPVDDLLIASIIWGFSLAAGLFSCVKCVRQTTKAWRRSGRVTPYIIMIWAEWVSCTAIGVLSWLFLRGIIPASFWVFFFLLCLWVVQIQCICGIIINRISLLMIDRRKATKIKWIVAVILGLVNISVFCIWIPARLQISETYIHVNEIWDRIEKGIFLLVDASLNFYFIYLVRTRLIANGLQKYTPLFRFNMFMVAVSMSLDVILIGSMSIGNGTIYIQFHPLVYILKLHIEMNIADLIVKVVQATSDNKYYGDGTELRSKRAKGFFQEEGSGNRTGANGQPLDPFTGHRNNVEAFSEGYRKRVSGGGITKIVQTKVVSRRRDEDVDEDNGSESSTRNLKEPAPPRPLT